MINKIILNSGAIYYSAKPITFNEFGIEFIQYEAIKSITPEVVNER